MHVVVVAVAVTIMVGAQRDCSRDHGFNIVGGPIMVDRAMHATGD